ncbi:MAG: hypothetical protein M3096_06845 [Actinomycetia bacterium]|nr:hypothetical protein [Actinomycetes bacterium]
MLSVAHPKRLSSLIVALVVIGTACAFPQQGTVSIENLEGSYYVNGTDDMDVEYGGRLEITRGDQPDRYAMQWIITGSVQLGTGVRNGDRLEGTWSTVDGLADRDDTDPPSGTIRYTISSDGTLNGTRTFDGRDTTGTEEAFPVLP